MFTRIFGLSVFCVLLSVFALAQNDPNGYNVFHYPNGEVSSEGFMKDAKPEGYWRTYYENGKLKSEGNRKNFELDSIWKFFTEEGIINNEISYRAGKREGLKRIYNKEGFLKAEQMFVDDVKEGTAVYYFPSGKVKKRVPFENGVENGKAYVYSEEGVILSILTYNKGFLKGEEKINRKDKRGMKTGLWKAFYDEENVEWEGRFVSDKRHGYFREYNRKGVLINTVKYNMGEVEENVEELTDLESKSTYHSNAKPKSTGTYRNGKPEGVHREFSTEGEVISSKIYRNGKVIGEGILDAGGVK